METNKIYQGDVLEVLKTFPDESINCIITSPPYNKHSTDRKCGDTDSWKKANIDYGEFKDDMPEAEYQEWQKKVLRECLRVLKKDGSIFYNHKPRIVNHRIIFPHEWLSQFIVRQMIIWITKEQKTPKFNKEAFQYQEIWAIPPRVDKEHPATFPEEVVNRCIKATTFEGDLVLDIFMGSGTVAISSIKLNRNFVGIELNPKFVEVANSRIQKELSQSKLNSEGKFFSSQL